MNEGTIDPRDFESRDVFAVRELLCSSHSGKGTGLECAECVRSVADERDRFSAENSALRETEETFIGWYWAWSEYLDDGWSGAFKTREAAEKSANASVEAGDGLQDGDGIEDVISCMRVGNLGTLSDFPDPAAELARLRRIEEEVKTVLGIYEDLSDSGDAGLDDALDALRAELEKGAG